MHVSIDVRKCRKTNIHAAMPAIFCVDRVVADHGALLCLVLTKGNVCRSKLHPVWDHKWHKQEIDTLGIKSVPVRRALSASWPRANGNERKKFDEAGVAFLQFACARPECGQGSLIRNARYIQARKSNAIECNLKRISTNAWLIPIPIDKSSFFLSINDCDKTFQRIVLKICEICL